MTEEHVNAMALRDNIIRKVEAALEPFDRSIKDWPSDLREIMWEAVALEARKRMTGMRGT